MQNTVKNRKKLLISKSREKSVSHTMSLKISLLFHTATFIHMSQTKQATMSKHKMSEKSQKKLLISKIDEKSVDRKAHRPALTTERRNRRSRGIFCRKDFCTNLLIHNLMRFLLNSSFTKFHLALFSVLS